MKTTSPCYLFVYGTLLLPHNQYAQFLNLHAQKVGDGKLQGVLFDLGNYPGAVYDSKEEQWVSGVVFYTENPIPLFKVLDEYEGIGEDNCEYIKHLVPIQMTNKIIECWCYIYQLDYSNKPIIQSGNYIKYLNSQP